MPDSKDLESYPEWFFGVARRFESGEKQVEVTLQERGSAYVARRQFYSWRKLVQRAGIPGVASIRNVSISLGQGEGATWKLIFRVNAGITPESLAELLPEVAGGRGQLEGPVERAPETPALAQLAPNAEDEDATEELVGRLMGARSENSPK